MGVADFSVAKLAHGIVGTIEIMTIYEGANTPAFT